MQEREVRRQDGREGTPTARREERGKVSSPGQRAHHCQHHGTLWYTHTCTNTHTRLANGPPSCPIRNCLISCAKQPLPCQPRCHLLPNNMAADQTNTHIHTNTHANTHKPTANLIPGTAPLLSHRDTHIRLTDTGVAQRYQHLTFTQRHTHTI